MKLVAANDQPPSHVVEIARTTAMRGTCQKSKRGAVIFNSSELPLAAAWNAPPSPFKCDGSPACRTACGKICVHAERGALDRLLIHPRLGLGYQETYDVLHVKVIGDVVVAGGPPSCVTCSREMLSAGIANVWLYERGAPSPTCTAADSGNRPEFECGAPADHLNWGSPVCGSCVREPHDHEACIAWQIRDANQLATWKRYTAYGFHHATLVNLGLPTTVARNW